MTDNPILTYVRDALRGGIDPSALALQLAEARQVVLDQLARDPAYRRAQAQARRLAEKQEQK